MQTFLQQTANGLVMGCIYAVVAVGFTLIFGVLRIVNFAHGAMLAFGAVLAAWLIGDHSWPLVLGIVGAVAFTALSGAGVEWAFVRPVRRSENQVLLVTLSLGVALTELTRLLFGPDRRSISTPYRLDVNDIGGILITTQKLIVVGVALVVVLALGAFLTRTKYGLAVRAVAQQPDAAAVVGISVESIHRLTFTIGAGLAALGGALYATVFFAEPYMGDRLLLLTFVIVVLGGLGSVLGALVGAIAIGLIEAYVGGYWDGSYVELVTFALIVVMLVLRPQGLLGKQVAR
jgi:branched-subunit amino acid ABC-type transport system permease component